MASAITLFTHLKIPLEEIVKATNNFDDVYVIGGGGFGKVYRGQLLVSGKMVNIAARRFDGNHRRQGDVEFWTEITMLSSLKHENIVSLVGFCDENGEKIIINKDEATRGSLSMYLSDPTTLTWIQRLKICVGVARALRCIHNGEGGRSDSVIHRNINSSTVLLDAEFEAKLSGFEYSIKQSVNRMGRVVLSEAVGTKGYMDPSILKTGGVSHKSDIFSFGVVLCEVLCGRKAFIPNHVDNRFLAPLFRVHYENNGSLNHIIHPDLRVQMSRQSLTRFSRVAYSCLENRLHRPEMNEIVIELEKSLELQQQLGNMCSGCRGGDNNSGGDDGNCGVDGGDDI
uniref:receptor-like protein kinase HERK 1 n=1 Tax=Erigeron canadensis TaxID=72917 RepID=UPI001CB988A7|nr:receptor-like protein kinase HERK 1 [Erigeron canadensis]